MKTSWIVDVAVPRPVDQLFSYRVEDTQTETVKVGMGVRVPFGRGWTHAYVVGPPRERGAADPELSVLKSLGELDRTGAVVPEDILDLCRWVQSYYQTPIGEVLGVAVPGLVFEFEDKKRKARAKTAIAETAEPSELEVLNTEQKAAVEALTEKPMLLDGITGSGKTRVYIEWARQALAKGQSVLVIVPEIALTPQLEQRFQAGLGCDVEVWHSALSDGVRRCLWRRAVNGEARVVLGARSAVFAPLRHLGLIVVDEEHDPSFKQEDRVHYHARDVALVRAKRAKIPIVLGSATPSIETWTRAREQKIAWSRLSKRARGSEPAWDIFDLRGLARGSIGGPDRGWYHPDAVTSVREALDRGEQVMVFLNRRGFAPAVVCTACGASPSCPDCSVALTAHAGIRRLKCHYCGHSEFWNEICGECKEGLRSPIGLGTESLTETLASFFPGVVIDRLDRDQVTSASRLKDILDRFRSGATQMLVGTQMLAKGHDFPNVTRVWVPLADQLFVFPDYRAHERALQILTQVGGRAGRAERPGRVLIQTFEPAHPVLQVVQGRMTRDEFYTGESEARRALGYPPFVRMARVRVQSRDSAQAERFAMAFSRIPAGATRVLGPVPAWVGRVAGQFRFDLLFFSDRIETLHQTLQWVRRHERPAMVSVLVDLDPSGVG